MGRENLEGFNAEFLVMLETWEAGIRFIEKKKVAYRSMFIEQETNDRSIPTRTEEP